MMCLGLDLGRFPVNVASLGQDRFNMRQYG